ncbi:MAG: efflux RND transporter periplasmic adaptor subunit [Bacillota bacterium]
MQRRKRAIVIACLALLVVVFAVGVRYRNRLKRATALPEQRFVPIAVSRATLINEINATGNVTSGSTVDVYSKKSGVVDRILVSAGDEVQAGDVLIELVKSEIDVQQAEATVRQRQQALKSAEETLEKVKKLYERGAATPAELRNAETEVANARDNLENAVLKRDQLLTDMEDSSICAPIGGIVQAINVTVGATTGTSSPVASIADLGELVLEVTVDEYDIGRVKPGQQAVVSIEALAGRIFEGTVTHVGKMGETRSGVVLFPVRIAINNATSDVRPGMSAEAEVIVEKAENVLAVPNSALERMAGSYFARVFEGDGSDEGGVKLVPVEVGMATSTLTEIVSGLSEGDLVAVSGGVIGQPGAVFQGFGAPGVSFSQGGRMTGGAARPTGAIRIGTGW